MDLYSPSFLDPLPCSGTGTFLTQPDWVSLWQNWTGPAVLLESSGPLEEGGRWVILAGNPKIEIFEKAGQVWRAEEDIVLPAKSDFWAFVEKAGENQSRFYPMPLCLASAWFGILSYEFGENQIFRKKVFKSVSAYAPHFYFFKPSSILVFDRFRREWHSFGENTFNVHGGTHSKVSSFRVGTIQPQSDLKNYSAMVQKAKEYISQGDIYQANLAQAFISDWKGDPVNLYRTLREINPGPFMGIFRGRGFTVVSSSPERLVAGQRDWLESRPIAGTRPRGRNELEDLQLQWELKTNPKEQAEHLMLVDLTRNDLGKVSRYGTVQVKSFAEVQPYAKVQHLVSVVQGQRKSSAGMGEILKSLFPGGTITGCPKMRSMEIIAELENRSRGFYTGSMGFLAPGPCFDFNILIRGFTLWDDGKLEFCAGAGIVADSNPEKEYLETLYKVEALARALGTSLISSL